METQELQIVRRGRFWAVHDGAGQLVCVAVYKKGAREVVRRLSPAPARRSRTESAVTARTNETERERRNGMARATHLTIGTADRIRLDARSADDNDNDEDGRTRSARKCR